jgi:hypothetical protein
MEIIFFNEVDIDMLNCFKEVRFRWKKYVNGVYKKAAAINMNEVINDSLNFKDEILEMFKNDAERERDVLKCYLINDVCHLMLVFRDGGRGET